MSKFCFASNKNNELITITCIKKNKSLSYSDNSFSKTFNLKTKSIEREKNRKYDKIIVFNDNEIILTNSVYESYSVFDLNSLIWTIYYSKEINIYQCNVLS